MFTRLIPSRTMTTALTLVALTLAAAPEDDLPALNQSILDFSRAQRGKTVGDGQCTSLAIAALRQAKAKVFPFAESGDFVWGRPVETFAEALPGDVLQFRDATFQGTIPSPGGGRMTYQQNYPHHTAIVAAVREGGKVVDVLHQNVSDFGLKESEIQTVREGTIRPSWLKKGGSVWIYRPIPQK